MKRKVLWGSVFILLAAIAIVFGVSYDSIVLLVVLLLLWRGMGVCQTPRTSDQWYNYANKLTLEKEQRRHRQQGSQ